VQFTRARRAPRAPVRPGQKQEADMNITSAKFAATMFTTLVVSLAIQAGYYLCCLKSLAL